VSRISGFDPGNWIERAADKVEDVVDTATDVARTAGGVVRAAVRGPSSTDRTEIPKGDRFSPARAAKPSAAGNLRVASYNVYLGPKDYDGVLATLKRTNPDVVGLQEVKRDAAEKLARELGMHMVFYGKPGIPFEAKAGKAILSKYPIETAHHDMFDLSVNDHLKAMWRRGNGTLGGFLDAVAHTELMERRGVLEATIQAGGKKIAFLDTHLTLNDADLNAAQMRELAAKSEALKKDGYEVVLVGDFNSNLAIKDGAPTTGGTAFADATESAAEYRARYGKTAGNIGDADDLAAAARLTSILSSAWETAASRSAITPGDAELTPDEARAALAERKPAKGSDEWKRLTAAADGATHLGANKRFDNILVSGGLPVAKVAIDMMSSASDHQLVAADLQIRKK
jgi:endonuclease/exonuclease/phosphatase family metal-dependent hydrolase